MMRKEAFTPNADTFAAKRRTLLSRMDERLEPHVRDAVRRVGLPQWQAPLVRAASEVFEEVARTESDGWSQDLDSLRKEFERELSEALANTKKVDREQFDKQVERVTRWVSTMSINAGTEAATSTDPDPVVGLEWVTMEDDRVRETHQQAHGQQTVTGKPFKVGGVELMYPGQPVGDPANWINCRCVARPAMLGGETMSAVTAAAPQEEEPAAPAPDEAVAPAPAEEPEPDVIPDEEAAVQVPFHGVAAPEGIPSGDGRMFGVGALTNRPLPLPMKAMFVDDEGHKGSTVAGRIDKLWKQDNLVYYEGVFDFSESAYEAIRLIADGMWRGVSVDVDQAVGGVSEDGKAVVYSEARIAAITICAIPAFAEAYIALGPYEEVASPVITGDEVAATADTEEFDVPPPKTMDGPGWITDPVPTHRITSYWVSGPGRVKIGWGVPGDFNRCRVQLGKYVQNPEWLAGLCANLHYRALGFWPGRPLSGETVAMNMDEKAERPSVVLTASAATVVSADYFRKIDFERLTPLTVESDGRVFGHLAGWETCHIGKGQPCVTAPHSQTNYAYFLTGEYLTDAGRVPVGQITLGKGGHAPDGLGMRGALSHYDNTGSAVADITVWEDEFGIAFSGKLRDDVSDRDVRILMASPVSGDWRGVIVAGSESLEMCAALAVNVQGFPIPRVSYAMDGDHQLSLVAAGMLDPKPEISPEFELQMEAYNSRQERRAKLAELRAKARVFRMEAVKEQIEKAKEE
jgi:hypothetical protein